LIRSLNAGGKSGKEMAEPPIEASLHAVCSLAEAQMNVQIAHFASKGD
jgi:hypothetical protein